MLEKEENKFYSVQDMSMIFDIKKEGIYKQLVKYHFDSKMVIHKGVKCLTEEDFQAYKKIREEKSKYASNNQITLAEDSSADSPEEKKSSVSSPDSCALEKEIELYKKIIIDKDKQLEEKTLIIEEKNKQLESKDRQAERFMKLLEDNNNTIKILNNSLAQLNGTLQLKEVNTIRSGHSNDSVIFSASSPEENSIDIVKEEISQKKGFLYKIKTFFNS